MTEIYDALHELGELLLLVIVLIIMTLAMIIAFMISYFKEIMTVVGLLYFFADFYENQYSY